MFVILSALSTPVEGKLSVSPASVFFRRSDSSLVYLQSYLHMDYQCFVVGETTSLVAHAGSSAEAARRDQRGAAPHFFTKRVADPNMIPVLVAAGVEFGAVKVWHISCFAMHTSSCSQSCAPLGASGSTRLFMACLSSDRFCHSQS